MNRPFTDHDSLIELQEINGVNMGTSLHSRYSSTKIVEHIATEMQNKIVHSIVSFSSKLSVLIDEATSLSHKSAMIVNVKASVDGATPEFVSLELVELESQRAEDIEEALLNCLENAAGDQTRNSKERQTYRGLARRMQSKEFLCDLGLMYDALSELANLSQQLQAHSITLLRADQLLKRTIRVLASFKDTPGEKSEEALTAHALGHFGSVPLESNSKLTPINGKQFLQSLINNMEKRLSFEGEMLHDLSVLDTDNWPSTPGIRHGEAQVKRLCRRFNLCKEQAVNGMRDFLEHPDSEPESLKPLIRCMQTFPCSTAECERGFSVMNNVCTDKRSTLLLANVSNLMMISINGPPVRLFEPRKYVTSWL